MLVSYDTKPTEKQYKALQAAYDFFNQHLFANELPECLIVLNRKRGAHGYFWSESFQSARDNGATKIDEIALNPATLHRGDHIVLATLVHEMVHLWQAHFGKPSRNAYHNKEWAIKMQAVGLQPSTTGAIGGKETGQKVSHYIVDGGKFQQLVRQFLKDTTCIDWYSHDMLSRSSKAKNKVVYICPDCGMKVWGKSDLYIKCGDCSQELKASNQ